MKAAAEIEGSSAHDDDAVTYWPRGLIQCTLPHSDPGDVERYERQSGNYYLYVGAGRRYNKQAEQWESTGIPYGSYPRLVCSFLARQAKMTRSRDIVLGKTLSAFMDELGLLPTGGKWGTIQGLQRQVLALVNAHIAFGYAGDENVSSGGQTVLADRYALWWDQEEKGENVVPLHPVTRLPSTVRLSEPLFEEIAEHAVPCDMRVLRALKQSALGLDLYAWCTYKSFTLKSSTAVSWKALQAQFGTGYNRLDDFRRAALKQIKVIEKLYPDFKYTLERGRIVIWPSRSSVHHIPKAPTK